MPFNLTRRNVLQTIGSLSLITSGCLSKDERVARKPPGSPALNPRGTWSARRFDAGNTGWNPDGKGLREGTTYWRLNAGGPASVAQGTLYNTFSRNRDTTALTYRDPKTARVETSTDLVQYEVNAPPVVRDNRVFVTTFIEVLCFDPTSGEQIWRGPEMDGISGQPTVQGDRVLVNSGGIYAVDPHLRAFDTANGDELWRYDTGHRSHSTPAVGNGRVFICSEGGLHAVDLATGVGSFLVPEVASGRTSPVADGESVFVITDEYAEGGPELVALDAMEGTVRWRVAVDLAGIPVVTDDVVYAAVENRIAALDRVDGSVRKRSTPQAGPVGLVGDVLYAKREGTVYAFDTGNELEELWSITTEEVQIQDTIGRTVYHVTPVDRAVYIAARDGFYGVGPTEES